MQGAFNLELKGLASDQAFQFWLYAPSEMELKMIQIAEWAADVFIAGLGIFFFAMGVFALYVVGSVLIKDVKDHW